VRPASRDQAVAAVRRFYAERGRLPLRHEWERAVGARPCARTIERRWGWRTVLAEAIDVDPGQVGAAWEAVVGQRSHTMLDLLRSARDELGRWPLAEEWERSRRRPSRRSYVRYFGSWRNACAAADGSDSKVDTGQRADRRLFRTAR
jgi:hypothetical protein